MGEINHFSHKQHPMKLIENWEKIVGVGDDESGVIKCYCCKEAISGESAAYGCIECLYFLHKACAELEPTFDHHLHPEHTLTLIDITTLRSPYWTCDVCGSHPLPQGFLYACLLHPNHLMFASCISCYVVESTRNAEMTALRKEATTKLLHEGHPDHTLTLQLRSATFQCDACKVEDKDYFYQCDTCDFWIHKTCASLAPTINLPHHPDHPLVLVYSLLDNFWHFNFTCEFCDKYVRKKDWLYLCANCRYFAHIKCALNPPHPSTSSAPCDVEEEIKGILQFPMLKEAFTDPLKLLHHEKVDQDDDEKEEISHWSHGHKLILNVEPPSHDASNNDAIEVCYGCVRPISLPYYSCKDGCLFTLHKYCAQLPLTLEHQLHPDHPLNLVNTWDDDYYYKCTGCVSNGNTLAYKCEKCPFYLDINCAFLPHTIKHESHKHPLIQLFNNNIVCKACDCTFPDIGYACKDKDCDFQLDMMCALRSPSLLAHRYCKGHEIPLTYPPVKDHPEDFYCDICEEEMHPKFPLYHCLECKNSFHLHCLSRWDKYENVLYKGTRVFNYHKHPLTYVRRKKTPQYVCYECNQDINGQLILECRTGTCPYRICYKCHLKKKRSLISM